MAEKKAPQPQARRISNDDRKEAIQTALAQIERNFGKGAIMRLGEKVLMNVESIPTGSMTVDIALGTGGLPRGRIIEIFGPESSGKTTLALHCIAQAQANGGEAAFIDAEHALDSVYAKKLGVDIDALLVAQPDNGEQALEITEQLVRSGALDILVVDSVAALVPRAEIDGEMGDSHVGLHARLMSQALRKLAGVINKTGCVVIFINQLREKVGISYGNPEVTTGGRALKFYASVRIDIRRKEAIKIGNDVVGNKTHVKIVKNKVAPPFREADFDIMYGTGISREGEVIDLAERLEVIKKSGTWFSYKETRLGQGKENVKIFLQQNDEIMKSIEAEIMERQEEVHEGNKTKTAAAKSKLGSSKALDIVSDEVDLIEDSQYEDTE